jgi:hypothetical protein
MTRYGKVRYINSGGGSTGKGMCSNQITVNCAHVETRAAKENRGYVDQITGDKSSMAGEDARKLMFDLGYLSSSGKNAGLVGMFLNQFDIAMSDTQEIALPKHSSEKIKTNPIIRSPLYGSW